MATKIELPYTLTKPQSRVFCSPARYKVCVAGRRFGKTVLALEWLATQVCSRPAGALGYYVAPYRVQAKLIAWDKLLEITRGLRTGYSVSELSVTLPGNRKIALKGADDPETLEGVGLVAVVLDEFARMKREAWDKSIRPALSDNAGVALFVGKPRGHNHLKEFYDRGQSRDPRWKDWESWLFTTLEGGNVPAEDVDEARGSLPDKVYRQEYEATFETLAGRVFDQFTRRAHVVPHEEIERLYKSNGHWNFRRIAIGVDFGFTDAGAAMVIGETATKQLVVVGEEYHCGVLVSDDGWLGIYKRLRDEYRPFTFAADPSEPGNIAAMRKSLQARPVVINADNRRTEGIRRMSVAMLPRVSDGNPGFVVSDRCVNLIRELEQYVFAERRGIPTEEPQDGNDHAIDATRYGVMAL